MLGVKRELLKVPRVFMLDERYKYREYNATLSNTGAKENGMIVVASRLGEFYSIEEGLYSMAREVKLVSSEVKGLYASSVNVRLGDYYPELRSIGEIRDTVARVIEDVVEELFDERFLPSIKIPMYDTNNYKVKMVPNSIGDYNASRDYKVDGLKGVVALTDEQVEHQRYLIQEKLVRRLRGEFIVSDASLKLIARYLLRHELEYCNNIELFEHSDEEDHVFANIVNVFKDCDYRI